MKATKNTRKAKATKAQVIEIETAKNFSTFEYEGALKAMKAIKEMDRNLTNPTLRHRYIQFQQIAMIAESQMAGDVLAD